MGVVHKRIFYFHADASVFGGHFRSPVLQNIPIQAPMSLSPSGGFGTARSEKFSFENIVSFERGYTTVSGHTDAVTGNYITTATSTVEGLSILGVVTADRMVARISSETPMEADKYEPTVTLVGSHFDGLKVSGSPVKVDIDQGILHPPKARTSDVAGDGAAGREEKKPHRPWMPLIENPDFLARVQAQYDRMRAPELLPEWVEDRVVPTWIAERYPANLKSKIKQRGMVLCSLVKQTHGEFAGTPYGSVISVPDFGRVFLGEILVDRNTHRLIMVRVELGCSTTGDASGPAVAIEGRTHP